MSRQRRRAPWCEALSYILCVTEQPTCEYTRPSLQNQLVLFSATSRPGNRPSVGVGLNNWAGVDTDTDTERLVQQLAGKGQFRRPGQPTVSMHCHGEKQTAEICGVVMWELELDHGDSYRFQLHLHTYTRRSLCARLATCIGEKRAIQITRSKHS